MQSIVVEFILTHVSQLFGGQGACPELRHMDGILLVIVRSWAMKITGFVSYLRLELSITSNVLQYVLGGWIMLQDVSKCVLGYISSRGRICVLQANLDIQGIVSIFF